MNKKSYSDIISERYIEKNNENSRVINYLDLHKIQQVETHLYEELPNSIVKGFPFASDFINKQGNAIDFSEYSELPDAEKKEYKLRYHYLPFMHELYIGTTGSGKTTTCIEPQLRAISSQKNKPNIFVSDPKGEIFLHNAKHLEKNGYKVQVLNFKNIKFSHCWNPLEEMYIKQMQIPKIGLDAKFIKGLNIDPKYIRIGEKDEFVNDYHIIYDGKVFPSYKSFNSYVDSLKFVAHAEVSSMVNQLCSQMFPNNEQSSDPTWSNGAREFFNGIMLGLLEDALDEKKGITKEMFNIRTVNDVFTLAYKYDSENPRSNKDSAKLDDFYQGKSKEVCDKLDIVAKTATTTKKGFLSTCQSMIGRWMNGHIFSLTTKTNITIDDKKQPLALFIITRDYDKSDNAVAGLFLNWVYRQFLEKAEKEERENGISAGRPIHFMLDEFANIPAIPDFEIKIATSRSRNMWFHIFLQSYEQLNSIYSPNVANIIIDNCNQQVFLGSQSVETKQRFSRECGDRTIKSFKASITGNLEDMVTLPVVPLSTLNNIETGWMYMKRIKWDVIESTYVRSYQCANEGIFKDFEGYRFEQLAPVNLTNPNDPKYQYKRVIPDRFITKDIYLSLDEEYEDDDDDIRINLRNKRRR